MARRRYGSYADPEKYLFGEKDRRDEQIRNLLNMFMMSKQVGEERGERKKEWGFKEAEQARRFEHLGAQERLWESQAERAGQPREPNVPAEIQAAREVSRQTGESVGTILNRWKSRKGAEPKEPGIKKSRQKWLEGLDKSIDTMIKGIQNRPEYGMDDELTGQVTNLQQAKTKIRAGLLLGADQPLPNTMWADLGKISENLEQIQKVGLFHSGKKPSIKAKLPKIKKAELPPGTGVKWNPKYNIKMGKIDGVWHWVIE